MVTIGYTLRDYLVKQFSDRKVVGYVAGRVKSEDRYIQVSTVLKDDMDIHYEYYQGYVELHLEAKYHKAENQDFVNQLRQQSSEITSLSWKEWQGKERYRCQINKPTNTWGDVTEAFKTIMDIFDPIIERIKKIQNMEEDVTLETKTLTDVLFNDKLKIPEYQRAYEWKESHVKALLEDTYDAFINNKTYILGTIILHRSKDKNHEYINNVVDGQQRLITLSILFYELMKDNQTVKPPLLNTEISCNEKSKYYIKNTQRIINEYFNFKNKTHYLNFIQGDKVTLNILTIPENQLSLAYTFFDGLNSKGKLLSDFDLLKAHHLMYIPENEENLARSHNDYWQSKDDYHKIVFEDTLRQIRVWSRGKAEQGGNERKIYNEFVSAVDLKDLDTTEHVFNRYMQPNVFRSWSRENDDVILNMRYPSKHVEDLIPIEIPQTIEGGDSFFIYAKRYHKMYELLFGESEEIKRATAIQYVHDLSKHITNNHIQKAFNAIVLLYYDKFGENKLIEFATCVEFIISKPRFFLKDGKKRGIRPITALTIRKEVCDKEVIQKVLTASQVNHLYVQIKNIIPNETFIEENISGVRSTYKDSIINFYEHNKYKLSDAGLKEHINNLYILKNKDNA